MKLPVRCAPPESGRDLVKQWKQTMEFTPDLDERATLLDVVAQPTRLRLFYVLATVGEICVCDLGEILGISQSATSQHLAKFKLLGLVSVRRDGQTLYYGLSEKPATKLLREVALSGIDPP